MPEIYGESKLSTAWKVFVYIGAPLTFLVGCFSAWKTGETVALLIHDQIRESVRYMWIRLAIFNAILAWVCMTGSLYSLYCLMGYEKSHREYEQALLDQEDLRRESQKYRENRLKHMWN